MTPIILFCALAFAQSKPLAVQIRLDHEGLSVNTLDGQWGRKSQAALERWCAENRRPVPPTPERAYDECFGEGTPLFRSVTVTTGDVAAVTAIPKDPAEKAGLPAMGYESLQEMFAERGHLSRRSLARLNPGIDWTRAGAGTVITIPDFPRAEDVIADAVREDRSGKRRRPVAEVLRISLSRFEITAYDRNGRRLALLPCSIAKDKAKRPAQGELRIITLVPHPNYTYTPDFTPKGTKVSRHILPPGPNNPVGIAWLGLSLPGYGIHGTPYPEQIGRAESHGCFRLANWNAARLFALCRIGTRVIIEE